MKNTLKGHIFGFLTAVIVTCGVTYAAQTVSVVINGTPIIPTDVNGNRVDPLLIDGTTYLPVRAVASALGLDVGWDEETYTVSLSQSEKPEKEVPENPDEKEEVTEKPVETEKVTVTEENDNVFEGIAQITTNDIDKETSKIWDREKGKTFTVSGVYMLGEWGNYKIVNGELESFEIIDHYGWERGKIEKTGHDNIQRFDPRFHIKFIDGTILTLDDRKVRINGEKFDLNTDDITEAQFNAVSKAIGTGEIWYKTNDKGYITAIDKVK